MAKKSRWLQFGWLAALSCILTFVVAACVVQKEHPDIKVNKVRDSTGVVIAKLLAEKDNPQADAVWGLAVSSLLVADQQGMLETYAPRG